MEGKHIDIKNGECMWFLIGNREVYFIQRRRQQ